MIRVKNNACVRRLAWKSLRANKIRNAAAILAIALTALLFTALFTIGMSINASFQESNFRMVGGYTHGSFKRLTPDQYDELKADPMIKAYGLHRFLGGAVNDCFAKTNVEVHHWDQTAAKWSYCVPTHGAAPAEGSTEAAADLAVLQCLGVEPKIGALFTVTLEIGGVTTEQTFALSGWWESDAAASAHIVLIPESRVDGVLQELGYSSPYIGLENGVGSWGLDVMLKSSRHIEVDLETILERHGYQSRDPSEGNYIDTGVNWGYTSSQLAAGMDGETVFILVLILSVILLTGYLVIYNVFRISVSGDVRFYGLLKTVGTTGRQLKRVIRLQALSLSLIGIPLGLLLGWLTGGVLAPVVLNNLSIGGVAKVSAHPLLFLGAAVFSLVTVMISCALPGRLAAKVSPVEAVRYTEGSEYRKTRRRAGRVSPCALAWANLGRSRSKTIITVLSLALAVVLLSMTVFFTNGFDMNKYLRDKTACDFLVAPNSYFRAGQGADGVSQAALEAIWDQGGVRDGGRMYFQYNNFEEIVPEEHITSYFGQYYPELGQSLLKNGEPVDVGTRAINTMIYGAEEYLLNRMTVIEGDLSPLFKSDGHYIAAISEMDDYGNVIDGSSWVHVGDTITLRYVEEFEYYDPQTGHVFGENEDFGLSWSRRAAKYTDIDFEVAAVVTLPYTLSCRSIMGDAYVMNAGTFTKYAANQEPVYYAFDTTEEANSDMESFLSNYTKGSGQEYNYESRASYEKEFNSFRGMFLLLGTVLSFIVGLVGIINFVNAVITGIVSRKRELAMLQAVGMTGQQLRAMLVWEGLFYALGSGLLAILLSAVLEPLLSSVLEKVFWFFSGNVTLIPAILALPVFAVLGACIPLVSYKVLSRQTIVDRLREASD